MPLKNVLSILFLLFFINACSGEDVYQCKDKEGLREKTFAFNPGEVTINRFQSFSFSKESINQWIKRDTLYMDNNWTQADTKREMLLYEYHDPLIPKIGAYKVIKAETEIVVSFVLEDIISVSQLPSGKLIEDKHDRSWYAKLYRFGEYPTWTSFSVQILMVKKYIFSTQNNTLTMFIDYPFRPERGEKVNWTFYDEIKPKYIGSMNPEELDSISQFSQVRKKFYPNCTKLKGFYLFLYHTMPLWAWLAYLT
ncbi:MAG: hypothetical protein OXB86_02845 [Bdellovibrionales bacterium]|nr:hypothetical protein [Bdellovibrionales bacterium]